jgi:hypothetical protein
MNDKVKSERKYPHSASFDIPTYAELVAAAAKMQAENNNLPVSVATYLLVCHREHQARTVQHET